MIIQLASVAIFCSANKSRDGGELVFLSFYKGE
jgi:hypothetical protein